MAGKKSRRSEVVGKRRTRAVAKPADPSRHSTKSRDAARDTTRGRSRSLSIEVVWSDLKTVESDVFLVGHYLGVLPQTAELELDRLVSGKEEGKLIIRELTRRGALRGDLGEVILFPASNGRVVALGGMGRLGTFGAAQVAVLARAVAQVIGLLPAHRTLATVLIGSGKGNLKVKEAVTPFLSGLVEALDSDSDLTLDRVKIAEMNLDRAQEILAAVKESALRLNEQRKGRRGIALEVGSSVTDGSGGKIPADFGCAMILAALARATRDSKRTTAHNALEAVLAELPENFRDAVRTRLRDIPYDESSDGERALREIAMGFRLREPEVDSPSNDIPSRVAFWSSDKDVRAAAITNTTTVTERGIPGRIPLVAYGSERLQRPESDELAKRAASLCRLLVPPELKDIFKRSEPLVVEVDRTLASMQWETLPAGPEGKPLGLAREIARQLRTSYSPRPFDPAGQQTLKALVIGDPADGVAALPEARKEAIEVAKILSARGIRTERRIGPPQDGLHIEPPQDGTDADDNDIVPADYFEIIDLLLSGEFDIVHYSGHAAFDPTAPDRAGWLFKGGMMLTANELQGMERPPQLVVANACLSSQVSQQTGASSNDVGTKTNRARGDAGLVASLADEFFKQGVSDYIGAAWEVPSVPAKVFAAEFYKALLTPGAKLGAALKEARIALYKQQDKLGTAWAAYQHYGDPTRSFTSGRVQARV